MITYNCMGLPTHTDSLYTRPGKLNILDNCHNDIVCLQETWLAKQDLPTLNTQTV